jgi:hypothetical protein
MRASVLQDFYNKLAEEESTDLSIPTSSSIQEKNQNFADNILLLFDSFLNSPELERVKMMKSPQEIFDTTAILTHAAIHEKMEEQGKVEKHPALLTLSEYAEYFDNLRNTDSEQFDIEFKEFQDNPPQDYLDANEQLVAEQLLTMFGQEPSQERRMFNAIQEVLVKERLPQIQLEFSRNKNIPYNRPNPRGLSGPRNPRMIG